MSQVKRIVLCATIAVLAIVLMAVLWLFIIFYPIGFYDSNIVCPSPYLETAASWSPWQKKTVCREQETREVEVRTGEIVTLFHCFTIQQTRDKNPGANQRLPRYSCRDRTRAVPVTLAFLILVVSAGGGIIAIWKYNV